MLVKIGTRKQSCFVLSGRLIRRVIHTVGETLELVFGILIVSLTARTSVHLRLIIYVTMYLHEKNTIAWYWWVSLACCSACNIRTTENVQHTTLIYSIFAPHLSVIDKWLVIHFLSKLRESFPKFRRSTYSLIQQSICYISIEIVEFPIILRTR